MNESSPTPYPDLNQVLHELVSSMQAALGQRTNNSQQLVDRCAHVFNPRDGRLQA